MLKPRWRIEQDQLTGEVQKAFDAICEMLNEHEDAIDFHKSQVQRLQERCAKLEREIETERRLRLAQGRAKGRV